jgi:ribosomal protein L37AE/L43A
VSGERQFRRVRESFACAHCGHRVDGDGYTNHCPLCLTSLHVDVKPGDRAADCGGIMDPIRVMVDARAGFRILHRCEHCGHEKWNRAAEDDDREELGRLLNA